MLKKIFVVSALILGVLDTQAWTQVINDTPYKIRFLYTADGGIVHWFLDMNPGEKRDSNDGAINIRRKYAVQADTGDGMHDVYERSASDMGNVVAHVELVTDSNGNTNWKVASSGGRISKD